MQRSNLVKYAQCPTFVIDPYIWDLFEREKKKKKKKRALPKYRLTSLNARLCLERTNGPTFITTI